MIKDSKIIGTKIAAPYGWKKFKVGELFDVCTTTGFDAGKLVFSNEGTPFIGRTDNNYGFQGFVNGMIGVDSNPANVISISQIGSQSAQYREESWYASQNMFYVELLDRNLTLYVGLFFVSIFNKLLQQYSGYTSYPTKNSIFDWIIDLPVTSSNQPDFAWMAQYMNLMQEDYLKQKELSNQAEIKAYLTESHTYSLAITDADRQFLRDFENLPRRKFKLGELFDYKSSKSLNKDDLTFVSSNSEFSIPYITRTVLNNGINGYVDSRFLSPEYVNSGSEFAFGLMGLTAFYQSGKYCTGQFVKRFVPKFKINSLLSLYFKTMIDRQIGMFKTVSIRSYDSLINDVICLELPVLPDSQVDFESIEKYIQIQSKPLINKVAETLAPAGTMN